MAITDFYKFGKYFPAPVRKGWKAFIDAIAAIGSGALTLHNGLLGRSAASCHPASSVDTTTTNFDGILSGTETTVQLALDVLDDHDHAGLYLELAGGTMSGDINMAGNDILAGGDIYGSPYFTNAYIYSGTPSVFFKVFEGGSATIKVLPQGAAAEVGVAGMDIDLKGGVGDYFRSNKGPNILVGDVSGDHCLIDRLDGTVRVGTATNNVSIQREGVYLNGDATMWDDLRFPATAISRLGFSDPDWVQFRNDGSGSVGVYLPAFDKTTIEELFFVAQMPHQWKEGSDIEVHCHWAPSGSAIISGTDVSWALEYTWQNINGQFGNTSVIYGDEQTNGSSETMTNRKHYITELGTISGTGMTMSSCLVCRLFRDADGTYGTDDFNGDAFLIEIDFHYEIDAFGSKEEYVKGP